ncbi:MAG: hypothetical protein IPN90_00280 [Elusimicrobia bacterium]|nr:hypothetical protein [Elusimicrobiota bacterium]
MSRYKSFFLFCLLASVRLMAEDAPPPPDIPPTVAQISVEGNKYSKANAVLSKVKVRKGDVVTDPAFRGDVDRLLESGLYEDVQVAVEDVPGRKDARGAGKVRVIFKIKERPVIRRGFQRKSKTRGFEIPRRSRLQSGRTLRSVQSRPRCFQDFVGLP